MNELNGNQKLPTEVSRKVYGYVKDVGERKNWQLVCRGWYHAANDVARIHVKVPDNTGLSLKDLFEDIEKYPTFGSKIISITDRVKEHQAFSHVTSERFQIISGTSCPFLSKVCFNSWSMKMFHKYLESGGSGSKKSSPISLKEVYLGDPTSPCNIIASEVYLKVC